MRAEKLNKTQLPIKQFESENSLIMADWVSIQQDLILVIEFINELIKRLSNQSSENSEKDYILQSLWISALICYARCFGSGVRISINTNIYDGLQGDPLGAHKFYIDLRSKQIAHSVNVYEQTKIGVVISENGNNISILGVAQLSVRHVSCDLNGCEQLQNLAKVALKYASDKAKELEEKIIDDAKESDISLIRNAKTLCYTAPGPEKAGIKR